LAGRANSIERGKLADSDVQKARLDLTDAQFIVARAYCFESWARLAEFVDAVALESSPVSQFESAVEAIIAGDVAELGLLVRDNPGLVRARSMRDHGATLLLYVGANLVEGYRQRSPTNAVEVAKILLDAGAEVDAVARTGGSGTTLGQAATSQNTRRAGVQIPLIDTLLDYGAAIDGVPGGYQPLEAALANGCPEAAEALARRGARMNIASAAGLGRLDLVQDFFDRDGNLKAEHTKEQMEEAFILACLYGRTSVAAFLLDKGVDPAAGADVGQTGFHLAAHAGHLETVRMLLDRNAPLEVINVFGGTVLGQAVWSATNEPRPDHLTIIENLISAGAKIEPGWYTGDNRIDDLLHRHR
jgi:ankyrin repeat protein